MKFFRQDLYFSIPILVYLVVALLMWLDVIPGFFSSPQLIELGLDGVFSAGIMVICAVAFAIWVVYNRWSGNRYFRRHFLSTIRDLQLKAAAMGIHLPTFWEGERLEREELIHKLAKNVADYREAEGEEE